MSKESPQVEAFLDWLPGEMRYSVDKANYLRKIERAKRPAEDNTSMFSFIGSEWFTYQLMRKKGNYYMPTYGDSAQQQLAKFCAGFFDKAALAIWLKSETDPTHVNFEATATEVAEVVATVRPWHDLDFHPKKVYKKPFDETPFADGLLGVMGGIMQAETTSETAERHEVLDVVYDRAMERGSMAVLCYKRFAAEYLTPDQYAIPSHDD